MDDFDWFDKFNKYLSTLDIEHTFALLHIIFFSTMLILVYNIIIVYYSEFLIKYFSIENKYPRLGRFIELRRKFQTYYMSLNIIILLLILLVLLALNLVVFLDII
jgi:prepilin signal peptidase PulO-like enzyme (type II secretory pathway)